MLKLTPKCLNFSWNSQLVSHDATQRFAIQGKVQWLVSVVLIVQTVSFHVPRKKNAAENVSRIHPLPRSSSLGWRLKTNLCQTECKPRASEYKVLFYFLVKLWSKSFSFSDFRLRDREKFNTGHLVFSSLISVRVCLRLDFSRKWSLLGLRSGRGKGGSCIHVKRTQLKSSLHCDGKTYSVAWSSSYQNNLWLSNAFGMYAMKHKMTKRVRCPRA